MSVGEYFDIGDPALQIRADEDGMKDPLNLLREAFDIYDSKKAPWEQSKAYFEKLKEFCDYSEKWRKEQEKTITRPHNNDAAKLSKEGSVMTREEAIAVLAESKRQNEVMRDNPSTFWASHQMADGVKNAERRIAALDFALAALRPVSREQVEKVWRGEWEHPGYYDDGGSFVHDCSKCNTPSTDEYWFCPFCGAPMTDEAVQMVMERMEALKDD